jgi:hypothetical protein
VEYAIHSLKTSQTLVGAEAMQKRITVSLIIPLEFIAIVIDATTN